MLTVSINVSTISTFKHLLSGTSSSRGRLGASLLISDRLLPLAALAALTAGC